MGRTVQSTTTDKTRLDTSISGNITLDPNTVVVQGFSSASTKTSGIMKTALMWYRIFLTERGSNPINKYEGTNLMTLFQSNVVDRDVLFNFVRKEIDEATSQIKRYQMQNFTPVEEQISNVSIAVFNLDAAKSSLDFAVNIFSVLGDTAKVEIPSIVLS